MKNEELRGIEKYIQDLLLMINDYVKRGYIIDQRLMEIILADCLQSYQKEADEELEDMEKEYTKGIVNE